MTQAPPDLPERPDPRARKSIVTGEILPEAKLVRFVAGPDQSVVPDVARKLPGRGLWVEADRALVEQAARKGAFSRAAKAPLKPPADLADQVEAMLMRRLAQGLGLARRSGDLISGFDQVSKALSARPVAWLIEASDGAFDGRRKLLSLARKQARPTGLIGVFSGEELDLALGLENVIHVALLAGRGAERWTIDVERLSGFRPLLPESWREDP
jgi:predicted RNA-binding protein YlxR (DUF448 family)